MVIIQKLEIIVLSVFEASYSVDVLKIALDTLSIPPNLAAEYPNVLEKGLNHPGNEFKQRTNNPKIRIHGKIVFLVK